MSLNDPADEFRSECGANTSEPDPGAKETELFDEIKEIVTCSIHKDIMKDPRKLSCQHAACYECLQKYSKALGYLICPICRSKELISDVKIIPPALTEKQIIDVVMKYKEKKTGLGNEEKDIYKQPLEDNHSSNDINNGSLASVDPVLRNFSIDNGHTESITSRTSGTVNLENDQETMVEHSQYELVQSDYIEDICEQFSLNRIGHTQPSLTVVDINIPDQYPNFQQIVFVDYSSNHIFVYCNFFLRTFQVSIDGKIVKPDYIRIHRGDLIMTGQLQIDEKVSSVFLHCTMNGDIIHQSEFFWWPESCRIPMVLGFDINDNDNSYYLCMPESQKINVYDATLAECIQHYELQGDSRPEYVAYCSILDQLWVSCPENKHILILNLELGTYRVVNTESIVPKMIFTTYYDEMVFLDSTRNRLVKIRKEGEDVSSEELHFPFINQNVQIRTFRVLPSSRIIISTETQILMYQPTVSVSRPSGASERCNVS